MNPTAIENHLRFVLMDWGIIIVAAWTFGRLAKRLGQPLALRMAARSLRKAELGNAR